MKGNIIEIDSYKKKIPGYNPKKADKDFKQLLKSSSYSKVILMCGGSASGKSEFVSSHLINTKAIVYDGTLSTVEGAKVKIRNILRSKKTVEISAIIPDSISKSFAAFIERDRKIPIDVFIQTHYGCRNSLNWISKHYPKIPINIFESSTINSKLKISKLLFKSHKMRDIFITQVQKTKDEIEQQIMP